MKLVFICGSLEPGRDGVGDYVRLLRSELLVQGHSVLLIAINDHYARGDHQVTGVVSDGDLFRFSNVLHHPEELLACKRILTKFDADLLSLQYVPFSFHSKGLSTQLVSRLSYLGEGKRWNVMFHELWVGMEVQSALKYKIWGRLQQYLIIRLLNKLKPVITTQTALYQIQLKKIGFEAAILPLFSNIPVNQVPVNLAKYIANHQTEDLNFVVFGTIHKDAPIKEFTGEAVKYGREKNINITLTFIGRCGQEQQSWIAVWSDAGLKYKDLGEQSPKVISDTLRKGSFGLCSTAFALVEKSGSVAAMRAHGLPVICISPPWFPFGMKCPEEPVGIQEYKPGNFTTCIQRKVITPHAFHVSDVVQLLLKYTGQNKLHANQI